MRLVEDRFQNKLKRNRTYTGSLVQWFSTFLLLRPILSVKKITQPTKPLVQISSIIKCFFIDINNKVKLSMIKLILMSIYQLVKLYC